MLLNYIKTAYRSMIRSLGQTLTNILGLSIGMTCTLIIFLWVQNQLSYDQWQTQKDNIYRLESNTWVLMPPYLGDLVKELPEVKEMVRFYFNNNPIINYNNNQFSFKSDFAYADNSIFDVFNFEFVYGNPKEALIKPFSVILTESIANKFFGNANPIGKILLFDKKTNYTVTGVIKDVKNMHLNIGAIASVNDITKLQGDKSFLESRYHNFLIYLLLNNNTDTKSLKNKINNLIYDNYNEEQEKYLLLRPFTSIYFEKGLPNEFIVKHGNIKLVLIFSAISFLVLLIACINFINITVAKANLRKKEIALRKILGANSIKITTQFLGETFIMVFIAHFISILLLKSLLPTFDIITGESIVFKYWSNQAGLIFMVIALTTLLAGMYPSVYLSSLKPILLLKGKSSQGSKLYLREFLMIVQFAISIFLIIATIVISKQIHFVFNKDLGMNIENIVAFNLSGDKFTGSEDQISVNQNAFTNELLKNPNILNVCYLNSFPGKLSTIWTWNYKGEKYPNKLFIADPEFVNILNLQLVDGRNLSFDNSADKTGMKIILNETAVKQMGLVNPVGTILKDKVIDVEVIGVVKDFNYNSLHSKIDPLAIRWFPGWLDRVCIKISKKDIPETVAHIKSVFNEFSPNYPFDYLFMDDLFAKQYENEIKQSKVIVFFACVAFFLVAMGLFGMASFIGATRKKEIGIRKAIGSSTWGIVFLFGKDFINWIIIAFLISSPIGFYLLKKWLIQYPYKTNIDLWIFAIAFLITFFITIITIGYQIVKSANVNPSECLRYE